MLELTIFVILIALVFDFLNGFHDAANSIATVVSTRVLTPHQAVAWAAFFNFVAAFGFGVGVAKTIGSGMININVVDIHVIMAGLFSAIAWDIITWYYGLPTSSSHALIGGYAGAAIVKAGWGVIIFSGWTKTLIFIVIAPMLGLVLGYTIQVIVYHLMKKKTPTKVDKLFRRLQLVSAGFYSLGHGTNDAQKTMGVIAGVLLSAGYLKEFSIPFWVILMCHLAIGLGTLFGGWRIVKTMGMKITKLRPVGGFCAETAGAITLIGTAIWGIPVSTTHTITGAIMGVGATRRLSAVRWGVATRIIWSWILTIPISGLIAVLCYYLLSAFFK
ncbi:MAG: inorganic phosphate transporter [Bacteroidota bacterium]